jgi:hypothetical protein
MVHIDGQKGQAYIKFQDIRGTEDVLKLTTGQVEYRINMGEISLQALRQKKWERGKFPLPTYCQKCQVEFYKQFCLDMGRERHFRQKNGLEYTLSSGKWNWNCHGYPHLAYVVCLFCWRYNPSGCISHSPVAGFGLLVFRGFLITHNEAPQSVGLLWTSDQSVAETST